VKKSRFTEAQIIAVLREQEAGGTTDEVCRRHGISQQTFYRWKSKYGGLEVSDAQKLKALEDENRRLKKLDAVLGPRDRSKGGRPSFDPVLKFRMLVLQAMHGLSLAQTEFLVADRLSWMRFCGLGPGDAVPDANTLWDFREALIAAGALDALFARLDRAITEAGYLPMAGQIVDATLVAAPRQRNT